MEHDCKFETLVIGIGNRYRNDDAAGLVAAIHVKNLGVDPAMVLEHSGEGASLLESWAGADAVILIDAVSSEARPGTIHRMVADDHPLPAEFFCCSSHAFAVAQAVELGRTLKRLPRHLIVFGIEGRNFGSGTQLSPEVEAATREVAKSVVRELRALAPAG
jgi:hydrogenase maturation protease